MITNEDFLQVILESFKTYLAIDTSRSTAKLKGLHGSIARDLSELYCEEGYDIKAQEQLLDIIKDV